jgi:tRNA dimethylallyltransferase
MASGGRNPDLVVITGPTAVGKTAVAVELARRVETEVISADSMQVYKFLSIGTAKPTTEELKGIKYHLVDFVEPDYQYNLGDFVQDADAVIRRLRGNGKLPIVCGGTCLYLKGLLHGIFDIPSRDVEVRQRLEARCEAEGLAALYAELQRVDPAATHIRPNDRQRILRALEVWYVTGRPISELQQQFRAAPRYRAAVFVLGMNRETLYRRIEERIDNMLARGLIDEARAYLEAGYSLDNPAVRALGYTELISFLRNEISFEEAIAQMKRKTRNYAKRQFTWFRAMKDVVWIDVEGKPAAEVAEYIRESFGPVAG